MAKQRHLPNPPIREALVDFRIAESGAIDSSTLEPLKRELQARFPHVEERQRSETRIVASAGGVSGESKNLGFLGLFFRTSDGKSIAQFRPDGFTLNRLAPYASAEHLFQEAMDLWAHYARVVRPKHVVRLALRYINSFTLPLQTGDKLDKFLLAAPPVPGEMPPTLIEFLTRVVSIEQETGAHSIVTQNLAPSQVGNPAPMILDVDVFQIGSFEANTDELGQRLEVLRSLKNRAFFSHLSEDAIKLFE